MISTRSIVKIFSLSSCGLLIILAPFIVANLVANSNHQLITHSFTTEDLNYLIVVARGEEPQDSNSSPNMPYRNSTLIVYHRQNNKQKWKPLIKPLTMRSNSTTQLPPLVSDIGIVQSVLEIEGKYSFGHKSVPLGLYWGIWRKDDFARHPLAIMLSDCGSYSGKIELDTTETLTTFNQIDLGKLKDSKANDPLPFIGGTSSVSMVKSWCFIHESGNTVWCHRDSNGCMNLLDSELSSETAPWEIFVSAFSGYDAVSDGPILVAIISKSLFDPISELPSEWIRDEFPDKYSR